MPSLKEFRNRIASVNSTQKIGAKMPRTLFALVALVLGGLACAFFGRVAYAQDVPASHYDWTPEQFTSEQYLVHKLNEVGGAMTADAAQSLDCGILMYSRIQRTVGAEKVLNGAIWTSFAVRSGDLREQGVIYTPEMEALVRATLPPAGLQGPTAQAVFARLRATPGGIEARTAECMEVFNQAAGEGRAYFEQRARFVIDHGPPLSNWSVEQLQSPELFAWHANDVAARVPLESDENIECQMVEVVGLSLANANHTGAEVIAWRRQKWAVFETRRQMLQNSGAVVSPASQWMIRAISDVTVWRSAEALAWQRALPPERIEACEQAFEASLHESRSYFEQRANQLARTR